jgi:predicted transcriptional regulator
MLQEIKAATGLGEIGLSKQVGVSQPTINRILNGHSGCTVKTWRSIVKLHSELVTSSEPA